MAASTYRVLTCVTTPQSELEAFLNAQSIAGYDPIYFFFGSDGMHHVAGGVQPKTTTAMVVGKDGKTVAVQVVQNQITIVFKSQ